MIISVERTLKLHYYTVGKVFSASPFPIFLCYSLIPKWIPFFFSPYTQHPTHILVMQLWQPLEPWHASQPLPGWFGAFTAVEALSAASVGLQTISHLPSASRCRRFSGTALCRADHNSWQPRSPRRCPPASLSPSLGIDQRAGESQIRRRNRWALSASARSPQRLSAQHGHSPGRGENHRCAFCANLSAAAPASAPIAADSEHITLDSVLGFFF